jgi:hypothetical protein
MAIQPRHEPVQQFQMPQNQSRCFTPFIVSLAKLWLECYVEKVLEHNKDFLDTAIQSENSVSMRPTNRSGESNFGKAKKILAMFNVNQRAELIQDRIKVAQFSIQEIETALNDFWSAQNLCTKARKKLDACPTKKQLQVKRYEEKKKNVEQAICAEKEDKKKMELLTKAFLVAEGYLLESDRLVNQHMLTYIWNNQINVKETPKREDLLDAIFPLVHCWTQKVMSQRVLQSTVAFEMIE